MSAEPAVIVAGVDGSDRDRDALALAGRLARALGCSVLAVHAHPYGALSGLLGESEYEQLIRRVAEGVWAHAAVHLAGVAVEMELVADPSPAAALHRIAHEQEARLLVVGSSRRGRVGILTPGSTTERMVSGSPCPVAVAPRGPVEEAGVGMVGVAYDGSAEAGAALALGTQLARAGGAQLRVIGVFEPVIAPLSAGGPVAHPAANEALRDGLRRRLEEAAAQVPDLRVDVVLADGDPLDVVVAQSAELDVLVAGSRGYGPVRSVLLGGVSGRLIRQAACPVVVCPRTAGD